MKFMKLGSRQDTFHADGKSVRYVSCDLSPDITVVVGDVKFFLHKFPLVSKSGRLQYLVSRANEESSEEVEISDCPGGPKAFEICAKFCYGMTVTLNAYNVAAARCAAQFLEMTEDVEKGNLIYKIEVFLNSSIFRTWKDSIILLQTTRTIPQWCEDLKIVGRCIDSISSKAALDPSRVSWSYTYNRGSARAKVDSVPADWWVEDICELEINLFTGIMLVMKSKGKADAAVMGEALKTYAFRWLPDSVDALMSDESVKKYKYLVETLIFLLPLDKDASCSCSFLLKLTKVAMLVGVEDATQNDLIDRISYRLHEASVKDLLIPADSNQETMYNVELVQCIVDLFMMRERTRHSYVGKSAENDGFLLGSGASLDVGRLIDGYLAEIACDPNLSLAKFMGLCQTIPDAARPTHDKLYAAIDTFLKSHPQLTKSERKKVCMLMDVKKLTTEASVHAAQNELLPLRVVVQVLYFEQMKAATGAQSGDADVEGSMENRRSLAARMSRMSVNETKMASRKSVQMTPSRSKRLFDKFRIAGKGHGEKRRSETTGSSMSHASYAPGEAKSSGSSSRHGRHSIS